MTGLDAIATNAPTQPKRDKPAPVCLECGKSFERGRREAEFCCRACRKTWNNRRMVRGALLFDLVMILRFERDEATKHKVWRTINRMARSFRDEDEQDRGGRRSWRRIAHIIRDRLYLWGTRGRI